MAMKSKFSWYVVVLILGLTLLAVSCGGTTSAPAEEPAAEETTTEETTTEETTTEEPAAEGPMVIPHSLEGKDDCLMCHETGAGEAAKIPTDHSGRTSDVCTACHQPAA